MQKDPANGYHISNSASFKIELNFKVWSREPFKILLTASQLSVKITELHQPNEKIWIYVVVIIAMLISAFALVMILKWSQKRKRYKFLSELKENES